MKNLLMLLFLFAGVADASASDSISMNDLLGMSVGSSFVRAGVGNGAELSAGTYVGQGDGWLLAGDVQLSHVRVTNTATGTTPATFFSPSTTTTTARIGTEYRAGVGIFAREALADNGFMKVTVLERVGVQVDRQGRDFAIPVSLGITAEPVVLYGFMFDLRVTHAHDQHNLATMGVTYQF